MPELPEVETVRRGLAPVMESFTFVRVLLNRPNLRFPFGDDFIDRVQGQKLVRLSRRAKFMIAELGSGDRLFMHLGMSGRFTIDRDFRPGEFANDHSTNVKHDHVIFEMSSGHRVTYNDPRRFGFMELIKPGAPSRLDNLGPEPMSNQLSAPVLRASLKGKKNKIKTALLDQRIIAGLGNIYVCEALYRARISPKRAAGRLTVAETETLTGHIKNVIRDAIEAGGSSLKDFANTDGNLGYFQHRFDVYDREDEPCKVCDAPIHRIVQTGRSTFYCKACQG
ncbi:MAG: bifunctional DNA-formamidopyrimidine glycosylase/DNA-(apurinic or apyrimidinic site) lyase [Hellea sp.]|nr:bifunctional DNA-formamidopyrimidine glycosylase/DNA-(apurinic or apyrimidinic site) lyase [Hellea sp.]